jgi:tagatose-6-phosphate ketose/aldose isomerase
MSTLGYEIPELERLGALYTAQEIALQPFLWKKIYLQIISEKEKIQTFLEDTIPHIQKIILTGAGTSAFIGVSLQGAFNRRFKIHTNAVATTDLVSHPDNYFFPWESVLLVSFARSGNSPESIAAVELADKLCGTCFHLIITCDPEGNLARYTSVSKKSHFILPTETNDKSLAMTASFSGMLLTGFLFTRLFELESLKTRIDTLYEYGTRILEHYVSDLKEVTTLNFDRAVFLGSGPFYGIATESQLKLQELTDGQIICKHDSYLGFRHGPKAITNEHTLIIFIFSNNSYVRQYEKDLVLSMNKGKRPMFTIGIFESPLDGLDFNLPIQLSGSGNHLDEEFLTVCTILPAQLLGFFKSLDLGLKPDSPSITGAISRVVEDVKIYRY